VHTDAYFKGTIHSLLCMRMLNLLICKKTSSSTVTQIAVKRATSRPKSRRKKCPTKKLKKKGSNTKTCLRQSVSQRVRVWIPYKTSCSRRRPLNTWPHSDRLQTQPIAPIQSQNSHRICSMCIILISILICMRQ
jgi:hypothetical protein